MSFATLPEAMKAFASLIEKSDGDLIKAQEWNSLVNGVIRIGTELEEITVRVTNIETYVGYQAGFSGHNLTQRIEALGAYVGTSADAPGPATLSARVAALEQVDNVTQAQFDALEESVEPLLEQYIVNFSADDAEYLIGDTATITATVRTLSGAIPQGRPWIDFIATWGKLSAAPEFEVRQDSGLRCLSVRTDARGIARVQVAAEQNKGLSIEEEDEVRQFFEMEVSGASGRFKEAVKKAETPQDEHMEKYYAAAGKEYDSTRMALRKLTDDYYKGFATGGKWSLARPANRYAKYRATVIGFAKKDADPTTPDSSRGVSSIQLLFKDWIGPWVDFYVGDDEKEVGRWELDLNRWVERERFEFLDHLEKEMAETIFNAGLIGQEKGLKALAEAAQRVDENIIHDPDEWVMDVVKYAADTQRAMNVFQDRGVPEAMNAPRGAAVRVMFAQSKQTRVADQRAAQAKSTVLASPEFSNLQEAVGTLQNTTVNVGRNVMGALQDIENKVVNINAFDSAALQTSVNEIKAKIGVARNLVPDR